MNKIKFTFVMLAFLFSSGMAMAQNSSSTDATMKYYNVSAGTNAPRVAEKDENGVERRDKKGDIVYTEAPKDSYGNARGNQYDLAVDGAFSGQTILVLQLYSEYSFDFKAPEAALKEKGFSVYRYIGNPPSPEQFKKDLQKSCQLWIISDSYSKLNDEHLKLIKNYWDAGHGLYIWGDNEPYYADANKVAEYLFGGSMYGNLMGDQPVTLQTDSASIGIRKGHLITTGLENVYEGITIATVNNNPDLKPIIFGSANNMVTAVYEKDGKRAILDGGFTRLYYKWETAGTDRYIKNAAAWLVNVENLTLK